MIRLWPSGADEFAPIIDDSGDSWVVGAAQCFARVAVAGALAASALSAQIAATIPVDDQFPGLAPPPSIVDDDSVPLALPAAVRFSVPQPFAWDAGELAPGTGVPIDDDAFAVVIPAAARGYVPRPDWYQDEIAATTPTPAIVEEDCAVPLLPRFTGNVWPAPWAGTVDELASVAPSIAGGDDDFTPRQPVAATTIMYAPWAGAIDEIATPPAPLTIDDDGWIPRAKVVVPAAPIVFIDVGDGAFIAVLSVAEYPPGRFTIDDVQPRFALDDLRALFTPDDVQPRFALDDVVPRFALDDVQPTFTLRQDYP